MSIEWSALGQVVVAGLIVGAGLPTLFALGLKLLNPTAPVTARDSDETAVAPGSPAVIATVVRPSGLRMAGAVACFAVVVVAVAAGIFFLVAGGH
jgi:hypothetical protein